METETGSGRCWSTDFGAALSALKQGYRVARRGWNGKGMWLALTPGSEISALDAKSGATLKHASDILPEGSSCLDALKAPKITIGAHIDMKAADGSLVIGWLASQTDMLAEDWTVLP